MFSFFLITIFYQQFLPATFPLAQPLPCASKMPGDKICRSLRSRAKSRQDSESAPGLERRWSHEFHCNPLKRNEWNWISLRMPADREDHNFDHLSTCNILVNTSHMVERIVPVENGACGMLGCVLPRISKGILKTLIRSDKCIQGAAAFLSSLLQDISQGCSISCSTGPAGSAHELSIGLFKTKVVLQKFNEPMAASTALPPCF